MNAFNSINTIDEILAGKTLPGVRASQEFSSNFSRQTDREGNGDRQAADLTRVSLDTDSDPENYGKPLLNKKKKHQS